MDIKQIFERYLENFFGLLIALNILHQIIDSTNVMASFPEWKFYFDIFYPISMVIFIAEIVMRSYLDRRLGFLGWVDVTIFGELFLVGRSL